MLTVAVGVDVRVASAGLCIVPGPAFVGCGVVLDNEIIPVGYPHISIGAYFGDDRAKPFIGTGNKAESIDGFIAGVLLPHVIHAQEVPGGAADKCAPITPAFRKTG